MRARYTFALSEVFRNERASRQCVYEEMSGMHVENQRHYYISLQRPLHRPARHAAPERAAPSGRESRWVGRRARPRQGITHRDGFTSDMSSLNGRKHTTSASEGDHLECQATQADESSNQWRYAFG
ncbi:hypothetical protein EVAR_10157_1 [Eumeta japonica]|uniref:Uncharacterized protein n=1 Tax=Eumeta variegata TaxID=151549 RepID=A0A4C1UDN0_EUMVA|nr:hypothetical protein EVAR_10157_1 [Eumeta japonica]